jgi:hypothetical protein
MVAAGRGCQHYDSAAARKSSVGKGQRRLRPGEDESTEGRRFLGPDGPTRSGLRTVMDAGDTTEGVTARTIIPAHRARPDMTITR